MSKPRMDHDAPETPRERIARLRREALEEEYAGSLTSAEPVAPRPEPEPAGILVSDPMGDHRTDRARRAARVRAMGAAYQPGEAVGPVTPTPSTSPATESRAERVARSRRETLACAAAAASPPVAPPHSRPQPLPAAGIIPDEVHFRPCRLARVVIGLLLLVGLAATGWAAYTASLSLAQEDITAATVLAVLTAVVWAVRAGSAAVRISVRGGTMILEQDGGRCVVDLANRCTPVEVHGRPGRHGWKVVFPRRGLSPIVIDSSLVDAREFMAILEHYRPELVSTQ